MRPQTGDVPAPRAVYGVLLNFDNEWAALGEAVNQPPYQAPPKAPVMYVKPANTWATDGDPIVLPAGEPSIQPGVSLGMVVGRTAVRVRERDALGCIEGFTVINDVRLPHASFYRPALKQLCRDGFCVIGSRIVPRAQVANLGDLELRTYVNGELRQEASTAGLVRSIPRLIADVTEFMTLAPGDILMVGVPVDRPTAGSGDRVRIEVQRVGSVENAVVTAAAGNGA